MKEQEVYRNLSTGYKVTESVAKGVYKPLEPYIKRYFSRKLVELTERFEKP